jgi:hypothetical protein
MIFTRSALLLASLLFVFAHTAIAAPCQVPDYLKKAPQVKDVSGDKEFFVEYALDTKPWEQFEVFVVVRQVEDPTSKGWFDFQFIGRAAVAESSDTAARLVLYKPFLGMKLQPGDRLVRTGDPMTLEEMELMRKAVMGLFNPDKETDDMYSGLISFKLGMYKAQMSSVPATEDGEIADVNFYKRSDGFFLKNFGLRWWFFFNPAMGVNLEYAGGEIPTTGFHGDAQTSNQLYLNPGLIYRSKFLVLPTIYSLTFFMNKFSTTNPDDFVIASTYSGLNFGATVFLPYRIVLLRALGFSFSFANLELGGGVAPFVSVSDAKYKRGSSSSGSQLSANAGVEFNLSHRKIKFTQDLFFVLEYGLQKYGLIFLGPTTGVAPDGSVIPKNTKTTESQSWYGIRLKYNMPDMIGELVSDI